MRVLSEIIGAFFELLRIIALFLIGGGILSSLLNEVYNGFGTDTSSYGWMGPVAILILLVVLYRNKLQFNGWFKGKGGKKLPKIVSQTLIFSATILLLLPPILSIGMN